MLPSPNWADSPDKTSALPDKFEADLVSNYAGLAKTSRKVWRHLADHHNSPALEKSSIFEAP